jgi:hypothetical protein
MSAITDTALIKTIARVVINEGLVKSRRRLNFVIPVKTGIQYFKLFIDVWIPACVGMTTFYRFIINDELVKSSKMRWLRKKFAGKASKPGPGPKGWD